MKVQILSLDAHDDRNSVLDRLGWVQANRVVLVWPPGGSPLRSHLDLVLVQRRARGRRVQLGLVTLDPMMRESARTLGIPVFPSAESFQERDWRRRALPPDPRLRREPPPPSVRDLRPATAPTRPTGRIGRALLFALPLVSVGAALIAALPSAMVVVDPVLTEQRAELDVRLSTESQAPEAEAAVPAEWRTTRITGELRIPTSGSTRVPAGVASGSVTFTNLTADPVEVPSGTGLRARGTGSLRFVTTRGAQLPAEIGAVVEVPIEAVEPGAAGNVLAGDIGEVEGGLGLQVAVANAEPTTGGSETTRPAVSAADLRTAYAALLADLQSQALQALQADVQPGEAVAEDTLRVSDELQRAYDAQPGEAADTLSLTLDVQIAGLVYGQAALEAAAEAALERAAPRLEAVPGSLSVSVIDGPTTDRLGRTTLRLAARRLATAPLDLEGAAAHIAGRPLASASLWLSETFDLRRPATITTRPAFLPWMPLLPYRIRVLPAWEDSP